MARVLTESFELDQTGSGSLLRITNGSSPCSIATTTPMDALRYMTCNGNGFATFALPTAVGELYGGFFFRVTSLSTVGRIITWSNSGVQGGLYLNSTTAAIEGRTGSVTVVGTGPVLTLNTLYHIQFRVLIDDVTGVLQVKVDDNQVINFTGDTKGVVATTVAGVSWGTDGGGGVHEYDSVTLNDTTGSSDNSWPGVVRILRLGPTGVGFYVNNWSRNTGSTNWEMVDEVPNDGDVTYLFTTSPNVYESFSMGDFSVANANIAAIITSAIAKKDSGTVQLAVGIRDNDNSTDYFGVNSALATTYGIVQERRTVDPSTGSAWTVAGSRATEGLIVSTTA